MFLKIEEHGNDIYTNANAWGSSLFIRDQNHQN